jgi:hypothetical protein
LEEGQALLIAAHRLPIDQAGPHLEVVHRLHNQRKARRPVVASARGEPYAEGLAGP